MDLKKKTDREYIRVETSASANEAVSISVSGLLADLV